MLATGPVDPLEAVRAEPVAHPLDQVGRQARARERVEPGEARRHRRQRHARARAVLDRPAQVGEAGEEERQELVVEQEEGQAGVAIEGVGDRLQKGTAEDAAGPPDAGDPARILGPAALGPGGSEEREALGVGGEEGGEQRALEILGAARGGGAGRPGQGTGELGARREGRERAGQDRLDERGGGDPELERLDRRPAAGALLLGPVAHEGEKRPAALLVDRAQDADRGLEQEAATGPPGPALEQSGDRRKIEAVAPAGEVDDLGEGLHDRVLDTVVDRLDEVAGGRRAEAGAAGLAVFRASGDRLEEEPDRLPDLGRGAGHERGPVTGTFFATRDAEAHESEAIGLEAGGTASAVPPVAVAAVDHDVALGEQREKRFEGSVDRRSRRNHQQDAARWCEGGHEAGRVGRDLEPGIGRGPAGGLARVAADHRDPAPAEIEGEAAAHRAEPQDTDRAAGRHRRARLRCRVLWRRCPHATVAGGAEGPGREGRIAMDREALARRYYNIGRLRRAARRVLPEVIFDFADGGAEDERTLARNESDFDALEIVPRMLTGPAERDLSVELFGRRLELPVLIAPTGLSGILWPDGEIGAARAAQAAGTIYCQSHGSTCTIEELAKGAPGPRWFQVFLYRDRGLTRAMTERAWAAGCEALVLTVDNQVLGQRERDLANGFAIPPRLGLRGTLDMLVHWRWLLRMRGARRVSFANYRGAAGHEEDIVSLGAYIARMLDPGLSWSDVAWLRGLWKGPFLLKGILHPDDARIAAEHGVDGVFVSNHGGRQLDGAVSAIRALPEVVEAAGDRLVVLLDGGVRRGVDVLRALALGARAVAIGRPHWWGLAVAGEAGVALVLDIFRRELDRAMALCGCARLTEIDRRLLAPVGRAFGAPARLRLVG